MKPSHEYAWPWPKPWTIVAIACVEQHHLFLRLRLRRTRPLVHVVDDPSIYISITLRYFLSYCVIGWGRFLSVHVRDDLSIYICIAIFVTFCPTELLVGGDSSQFMLRMIHQYI
jgi:hypothetical protein